MDLCPSFAGVGLVRLDIREVASWMVAGCMQEVIESVFVEEYATRLRDEMLC